MTRFLPFLLAPLFLIASSSLAQTAPASEGVIESMETDPATRLPVHVLVKRKAGAPWVVLIHGLGERASQDWMPVVPQLAEHYQLLLFDLPGFGESAQPDTALTPRRYADLVHNLVLKHANAPVHVVGHSLGGAVALRYGHDYPAETRQLLLIDVAGMLQASVFARYLSRVSAEPRDAGPFDDALGHGEKAFNRVSGKVQDLLARFSSKLQDMAESDEARNLFYRDNSQINASLGLIGEDFTPLLREIRMPVRILWGEEDPVAPLRTGIALQWWLPQARLQTLPGVGHMPMGEAPEQTADWLLASLAEPRVEPVAAAEGESQGDGICRNQKNLTYRGKWRSLRLERCANIRIENASLDQLTVTRSQAVLENVRINATDTAIKATGANITATGVSIMAPEALQVSRSRLDFAAVNIMAPHIGRQKGGSQFFFSLGYWCDGANEWRLHDVWRPRNGVLDRSFRKIRDSSCFPPDTPRAE